MEGGVTGSCVRDTVTVRVPATTANLGPGFDCLALTLDLWNQATFTLGGSGLEISVAGEGAGRLARDRSNMVAQALARFFVAHGEPAPSGLRIDCQVAVPLSSGLGSSASAALAGILAANTLLGEPADRDEVLRLAAEVEGHPDNVAAALFGGLVMVVRNGDRLLTRRVEIPPLSVALAVPELDVSTSALRAELPGTVSRADAVFNLGRTALVVQALQDGDLELLGLVMEDKLHQSHRLAHIPGGAEAMAAARAAGAAAVALSGSGPSLIAFVPAGTSAADVAAVMAAALGEAGVPARQLVLATTAEGARVTA